MRQAEILGLETGENTPDGTRSELEERFLRLCRRHRIPKPEVNARVGPFLVDFLWRDARLIVETDGYRFHRGRQAFEGDRARDAELKLLGNDVLRFTYTQITREPLRVARTLRALRLGPRMDVCPRPSRSRSSPRPRPRAMGSSS
jgi:very-short-patch-repair endonuclease